MIPLLFVCLSTTFQGSPVVRRGHTNHVTSVDDDDAPVDIDVTFPLDNSTTLDDEQLLSQQLWHARDYDGVTQCTCYPALVTLLTCESLPDNHASTCARAFELYSVYSCLKKWHEIGILDAIDISHLAQDSKYTLSGSANSQDVDDYETTRDDAFESSNEDQKDQ